jgi:Lar family restriction alleviation protein
MEAGMNTTPELKPCPFCGGKAAVFKRSESRDYDESFIIACAECRERINPFYTLFDAAAAWNAWFRRGIKNAQ